MSRRTARLRYLITKALAGSWANLFNKSPPDNSLKAPASLAAALAFLVRSGFTSHHPLA
jgi:hypothetical protein